ncbi:transcriptional regulator [Vibrio sp. Isolate23]|uniref:helix-turn-helix transcriptional regulator n=1 Tax=Vibrio sp. Isolate23 TaxID=2908533 RepID=UPI001EFD1D58|nr:metalloregulator ArsR/SmtB family transcription factor [Vibrio sp. Isolate23]MCG9683949.1 transcriptional regulator [Vibrio sp. Isolate23]
MKSTEKILQVIKTRGAVTVKELAQELGMTTMGVRQHLQKLEKDGLLSYEDRKAKIGRPTRHWLLTALGHRQFADRHGELTIQVIDAVEHLFGADGLKKVAEERERSTFLSYQMQLSKLSGLEQRLIKLVELRQQEGYMAELEECNNRYLLIENHCPICNAAVHCPALCQSELNVFQKLLGDLCVVTRTEHIIQGQRRCCYDITPIEQ